MKIIVLLLLLCAGAHAGLIVALGIGACPPDYAVDRGSDARKQLQAGLLPISYVGAPQCAPFGGLFWTAVCSSATASQAVVSVFSTSNCQGAPLDAASLLADGETCTTKRYPTFMTSPANFVATCTSPYEWPVSFSGHVGSMSQVLSRSYYAP